MKILRDRQLTVPIDAKDIQVLETTPEGYVSALRCRIARSGNMDYLAYELGLGRRDGYDFDQIIKVYRSPEDLMDAESVLSLNMKPLTAGHPYEDVTISNWKEYATGAMSGTPTSVVDEEDGYTYLLMDVYLLDPQAVGLLLEGVDQLSLGYYTDVVLGAGVAEENGMTITYDARQTAPWHANHLAQVPRGRAGNKAKIDVAGDRDKDKKELGDSKGTPRKWHVITDDCFKLDDATSADSERKLLNEKETDMSNVSISLLDGDVVEVAEKHSKTIKDHLKSLTKDKEKALADAELVYTTTLEAKDAELETANKKIKELEDAVVSDADLEQKIADKALLIETAKAMFADVAVEGKTDVEIMSQVITDKLPAKDLTDADADAVKLMFDTLVSLNLDAEGNPVLKVKGKDSLEGKVLGAKVTDAVAKHRDALLNPASRKVD